MIIQIICRDSNGWPIMTVNPPIVQGGDGIRIQNYALDRFHDLKRVCDAQREATKKAKEGKALHRSVTTFKALMLYAILGKSLDEVVEDEIRARIEKGELSDNRSVTNG